MNADLDSVIVDACTLKNFSVVNRLDILEQYFSKRTLWTPAIQREAGRLQVPAIDWLNTSISAADDLDTLIAVDRIRRGLGATQADPATLHLGEAEAIHIIETQHRSWTFVSDDQPAVDFAVKRGLKAYDTHDLLADCYTQGLIGCPEAFEVLLQMVEAGRGVRVPPSHWYLCPPRN